MNNNPKRPGEEGNGGEQGDCGSNNKRAKTAGRKETPVMLRCSHCKEAKPTKSAFSSNQSRKGGNATCKACIAKRLQNQNTTAITDATKSCSVCQETKPLDSFPKKQRKSPISTCYSCLKNPNANRSAKSSTHNASTNPTDTAILCGICQETKPLGSFHEKQQNADKPVCRGCYHKQQQMEAKKLAKSGEAKCAACQQTLAKSAFHKCEVRKKEPVCMACFDKRKQEELVAPRTCMECKQLKPIEEYGKSFRDFSWLISKSICFECFWCKAKKKFLALHQNYGVQRYGLPYDHYNYIESCFEYADEMPSDLIGTYNIVYHHAVWDEVIETRQAKGTVTLERKERSMLGRVQYDPKQPPLQNYCCMSFVEGCNYTVIAKQGFDWPLELTVENGHRFHGISDDELEEEKESGSSNDEFEEEEERFPEIDASLYFLKNRLACRWQPVQFRRDEETVDPEFEEEHFADDRLVRFDSLEQAEALEEEWRRPRNHWLCRHKSMTPEISKQIQEYCFWSPCPVLFLEPGDLVLRTDWDYENQHGSQSFIVARKTQAAT